MLMLEDSAGGADATMGCSHIDRTRPCVISVLNDGKRLKNAPVGRGVLKNTRAGWFTYPAG